MRRWPAVAPAVVLVAAGCLASKSDIRLLQDELRATRTQLATGDTSILRADEARQRQIAALSAQIDRALDSLRTVASRLATFQANATGNFETINEQIIQMRTLLGQTTRSIQDTRAQLQQLREQGGAAPVTPATPTDSGRAPASGVPGPATLYNSAVESINQGAPSAARRGLETLVSTYPQDELAPRALLKIGDLYRSDRNQAASDSVYRLVYERYPKSSEAAMSLYHRGKALLDANRRNEATQLFNIVRRDYPNTQAAQLVADLTKSRP
jgi:TolA-binding protein